MITSMSGCVTHIDLWPWPISSRIFSHEFAIRVLKCITSCLVYSTVHTVLNGFFQYLAQMITSITGCAVCYNLWSWPISSRSFSFEFAIKLLKYVTSCHIRSTAHIVVDGFFLYLAQITTSERECVMHNDLWPLPTSRSFSHDFAAKLLKYGTCCWICSIGHTVLDGFFLHLAKVITSIMAHFAISTIQHVHFWLDSFPIGHKWSLAWEGVAIGQRSRSHRLFEFLQSGQGYPSRSLIYNFKFD